MNSLRKHNFILNDISIDTTLNIGRTPQLLTCYGYLHVYSNEEENQNTNVRINPAFIVCCCYFRLMGNFKCCVRA